ncbi:MAG: sterol desaturase family protein [Planctomycetota bacterium]
MAGGLLAFDCWMYWWHRLNHRVPLLWRLHRVHHSDTAMDASSGLRFHPGEILLSGAARLIVVPLLGVPAELVALYGAVALPVVLAHHANVWLPRWLDFGLFTSGLLVTPAMHRVHHSRVRDETNSNYSSVLPIWDRLFGTLCVRRDIERIDFGLDEFRDPGAQTVAGMLTTPLATGRASGAGETRESLGE